MSDKLIVKELCITFIDRISKIHRGAFPDAALTRLGHEAVKRYYLWLLQGPHNIYPVGCWYKGDLSGYCIGGSFQGAFSGFVKNNLFFLFWIIATHPCLLINSQVRDRINLGIRAYLKKISFSQKRSQRTYNTSKKVFGILVIAVDPQFQGEGVGGELMTSSEDYAIKNGYKQMSLTVHKNNYKAINFYEKYDWQQVLVDGNWEEKMEKVLS